LPLDPLLRFTDVCCFIRRNWFCYSFSFLLLRIRPSRLFPFTINLKFWVFQTFGTILWARNQPVARPLPTAQTPKETKIYIYASVGIWSHERTPCTLRPMWSTIYVVISIFQELLDNVTVRSICTCPSLNTYHAVKTFKNIW
jgi:hypothetical protein